MIYSLADFKIEYENRFDFFNDFCSEYIASGNADFTIKVTDEDLLYEKKAAERLTSDYILETLSFYRKLANELPNKNALLFHSALFELDGIGVALAAHSGTGKTTHMLLWKQLFGDKVKIINGDKPIIRFFENQEHPYGYGTPWNGKENLGQNSKTKLKHICFIEQSDTNSCEKIQDDRIIDRLFNQIYMPKTPHGAITTMHLMNRLIKSCEIWNIKCNTDISAAKIAYNTIFNKKDQVNYEA